MASNQIFEVWILIESFIFPYTLIFYKKTLPSSESYPKEKQPNKDSSCLKTGNKKPRLSVEDHITSDQSNYQKESYSWHAVNRFDYRLSDF